MMPLQQQLEIYYDFQQKSIITFTSCSLVKASFSAFLGMYLKEPLPSVLSKKKSSEHYMMSRIYILS